MANTYTVEQAVDAIGFGIFQVKLSLLTGLAWMADAMEMMILSILSPALHCDWRLTEFERATITTVVFCGMMASSGFWGYICDKYGRKAGDAVCRILRQDARAKVCRRMSEALARGCCWLCCVMPTMVGGWLLIFSAVLPLAISLTCVWLPESARYHIASGHPEKAVAVLERVARDNNRPMPLGRIVASTQTGKRGRVSDLFIPETRYVTILLWFIWLATAFTYYGLVLMTTELFEASDGCHGGDVSPPLAEASCYLTCRALSKKDYTDLLWTTLAEGPGLLVTFFIIDRIGRKKTMAVEFALFSLFTFLLFMCSTRGMLTFFIFVARAFVSGAFQAIYVYTPEVYPTTFRAVGLGTCSGFARVGAIITPFVAQVLLRKSVNATVAIYGTFGLFAAIGAMLLPIETQGRPMKDHH
ncbi:PREDICTED: synaptic vesicle 2-related protein-like [Priapulus caudatus]|uniref:Synaptic vesicle 2-related protein-like n=1 Tax=Priapulus caudatus TaxID=37621 RepID=A0ABM1ERP1_PRICU|nr:PREDICTED: synaptic vesicle 2-related protein-like [Priapulus caudatus]